jgi:hypothetical protein
MHATDVAAWTLVAQLPLTGLVWSIVEIVGGEVLSVCDDRPDGDISLARVYFLLRVARSSYRRHLVRLFTMLTHVVAALSIHHCRISTSYLLCGMSCEYRHWYLLLYHCLSVCLSFLSSYILACNFVQDRVVFVYGHPAKEDIRIMLLFLSVVLTVAGPCVVQCCVAMVSMWLVRGLERTVM